MNGIHIRNEDIVVSAKFVATLASDYRVITDLNHSNRITADAFHMIFCEAVFARVGMFIHINDINSK